MKMILAAALALGATVGGAHGQAADKPAKAQKADNPNKKTCRRERSTGSIMPTSTCHTNAEWTQIDAERQADTQATLDQRDGGLRASGH